MQLTDRVYLVGSGDAGFSMTDPLDCHVYLIDGGEEMALIDAGIGRSGVPLILGNVRDEGLEPGRIKYLMLTHTHADHAGGASRMRSHLGCQVLVSEDSSDFLRNEDEVAINLHFGKEAGFYPQDYVFEACEVDVDLSEGQRIQVGDCELEVIDTPGHCAGHLAFLMEDGRQFYLFSGDTVFFGGKILLQNIHDCILQDYARSVLRLSDLSTDVFLPGHGCISLKGGQRHIDEAAQAFKRLGVPPNLL